MKYLVCSLLIIVTFISCGPVENVDVAKEQVWKSRMLESIADPDLEAGSTFLSIYSQIYTRDDKASYDLTTTVSMHNPNALDSVYVDSAVYYNTEGKAVRTYFVNPIFIRPMETVQIIIPILDNEGGTGANFIFDWRKKSSLYDPLFEAVMVSGQGTHGISFVTVGKRLR